MYFEVATQILMMYIKFQNHCNGLGEGAWLARR